MARRVSAAQAKAQLADCLRKAEGGEPVIITRHGKPVAALIGGNRMASITRGGSGRGAGGLADLAGGWEGIGQARQGAREAAADASPARHEA